MYSKNYSNFFENLLSSCIWQATPNSCITCTFVGNFRCRICSESMFLLFLLLLFTVVFFCKKIHVYSE